MLHEKPTILSVPTSGSKRHHRCAADRLPLRQALIHHLNAAHDRFGHMLCAYSDAGRGVDQFIPYEPVTESAFPSDDVQSDQQARAQGWPTLLRFLSALVGGA